MLRICIKGGPPFSFSFSLASASGPSGLAISFPGNFFPDQSGFILSLSSPVAPVALSVLRDIPAGFFISPAANDSAVWKVGVIFFNFVVSGKKYREFRAMISDCRVPLSDSLCTS